MLRLWVLREINSRFCSKTQWQMFLLVSGRHVGAPLGGHQHGGSIQISINLGKTFLLISSVRKIAVIWILARVFAYLPSFYFQILDLIDRTIFIFYFDLFWMAWHWKPAIDPYTIPSTRSNFLCGGDRRPGLERTEALKQRLYFVACLIYNTTSPRSKVEKDKLSAPPGDWNTKGSLLSSDWDIINHHANERKAPVSSIE